MVPMMSNHTKIKSSCTIQVRYKSSDSCHTIFFFLGGYQCFMSFDCVVFPFVEDSCVCLSRYGGSLLCGVKKNERKPRMHPWRLLLAGFKLVLLV